MRGICGIVVSVLLSGAAFSLLSPNLAISAEGMQPEITENNWEHHPGIMAIRKLYNDIQFKLENGELTLRKKDFATLPRSCRGTYPLEYLSVAVDKAGRARVYIVAQRISHDDLMTTRNYYDENGRLRFAYITNESEGFATIEHRVYLAASGEVLWDVRSEAGKFSFGEITSDSFEIRETTSKSALSEFDEAKVKCKGRSK